MKDPILTVDEAAEELQLHPFTVLKLIRKGRLKASKIGRVYRIRESSIDAFLDENEI
ncbi:DNA-binding protein [Candidatus Peregrinibacteria bacterium CG_4_9_14_0_2_um_filter_53_11]|nr:MAG: DNA-binding protein [Candidatus Peregrinibacteria bacterium CG_4_9_14_0_2_um_filter_53_11]